MKALCEAMNTLDIENILMNDNKTKASFRGVFAMDEMVKQLGEAKNIEGTFIFNTQPSKEGGEHWICVIINPSVIYYFDSFGRHPKAFPHIASHLLSQQRVIEWNTYFLQNITTTVCGDYCVLFALCNSRGWNLHNYVDWLYSLGKSESRDHTLRRVMLEMFGPSSMSSYSKYPFALSGVDNIHLKQVQDSLNRNCIYLS